LRSLRQPHPPGLPFIQSQVKKIQIMMLDNSPYANLVQPGRQIGYRADLEGVRYNAVYQQDFTKLDRK
jgi:hypothetical protein